LQDFEGSDEAGKLTSLSIQTVTCSSMLLSNSEIGSENASLLSDSEIGSATASLPIQKSAAMVESIYIYIYIYGVDDSYIYIFFWVFTFSPP
jgi:hypothetical protein